MSGECSSEVGQCRARVREAMVLAMLAVTIAAAWRAVAQRPGRPADGQGPLAALVGKPLDLNQADPTELASLPGLGPALARRIAEDRAQRGPFRSVDDLDRVRGIGPSLVRKLQGKLEVGPSSSADAGDAAAHLRPTSTR